MIDRRYVLKTHYGAYIRPHSNGEEMNYEFVSLDDAYKYSYKELRRVYKEHKDKWKRDKWEVWRVGLKLEERMRYKIDKGQMSDRFILMK